MVDVSAKAETPREAVARAVIRMRPATLRAIQRGNAPKGDVLGVARTAGILAAKRTPELIPLCHPLRLTRVEVAFDLRPALAASMGDCARKRTNQARALAQHTPLG